MTEGSGLNETTPAKTRVMPVALHHCWTIAAFIAAIVQVLMIRGINVPLLLLFLLPPGFALYIRYTSTEALNRVLASVFLTLIDLGGLLKAFPRLFPDFKGFDFGLSSGNNRFLSWYLAVLFAQLFCLNLVIIFAGQLILRARGRKTQHHPLTCCLGLSLGLLLSIGLVWGAVTEVGLWPVWR